MPQVLNSEAYYLGLPMWAHRPWVGELFSSDARKEDLLAQYASVFNAVEGNTTFYALPKPDVVKRWRNATPPGFLFCCKFPKTISHEARLVGAAADTTAFLNTMTHLENRCGPLFLQLPATFSPEQLPVLRNYLDSLSKNFHYAVEVRHPGFFDRRDGEQRLNALLEEREIDRVSMDTRILMRADPVDAHRREMQRRKPNLPVRKPALARFPFVRLINADDDEQSRPLLASWADVVTGWVHQGLRPFVFIHSSDDFHSPRLARLFHTLLTSRCEVGPLPRFPAMTQTRSGQLTLL